MTPETPTPDLINLMERNRFAEQGMTLLEALTILNNRHRAEVEAMREAVISSYHMLKYFERFMPNLVDLTEQQWLNTQEGKNTVSALAKLKPFIKP